MDRKKESVSRQTLWQRKHRALGLCVVCSHPAYKGWRCVKHYEQHKIVMRLRYIPKVRGRYDVGGSMEFIEAAQRAARRGKVAPVGPVSGGPFGPFSGASASAPAPAAVPAGRDGRTLQAKRRQTVPRATQARKRSARG